MSTLGDHIHKWGGSFIKCCSECGEPIKQLEKGGEYVLAYGNKALDNLVAVEECETCEGDGVSRCTNPDHGFIEGFGGEVGRLGCPVCGHDPDHKVKGESCDDCNGNGTITRSLTEAEWKEFITYILYKGDSITLRSGIKVRRIG